MATPKIELSATPFAGLTGEVASSANLALATYAVVREDMADNRWTGSGLVEGACSKSYWLKPRGTGSVSLPTLTEPILGKPLGVPPPDEPRARAKAVATPTRETAATPTSTLAQTDRPHLRLGRKLRGMRSTTTFLNTTRIPGHSPGGPVRQGYGGLSTQGHPGTLAQARVSASGVAASEVLSLPDSDVRRTSAALLTEALTAWVRGWKVSRIRQRSQGGPV